MAKNKSEPIKDLHELPPLDKTEELGGLTGPGVEALKIPEIEKCVTEYERKKELRCQASPDEIAAKNDLREALHQHKDKLPKNADGLAFYRCDGVDYILEESLRRRKVDTGEEGSD